MCGMNPVRCSNPGISPSEYLVYTCTQVGKCCPVKNQPEDRRTINYQISQGRRDTRGEQILWCQRLWRGVCVGGCGWVLKQGSSSHSPVQKLKKIIFNGRCSPFYANKEDRVNIIIHQVFSTIIFQQSPPLGRGLGLWAAEAFESFVTAVVSYYKNFLLLTGSLDQSSPPPCFYILKYS